jgi:hypothetical protein
MAAPTHVGTRRVALLRESCGVPDSANGRGSGENDGVVEKMTRWMSIGGILDPLTGTGRTKT